MASLALLPTVLDQIGMLFASRTGSGAPVSSPADDAESIRIQRDFVDELLTEHADAFASELDVQSMMSIYPGRF